MTQLRKRRIVTLEDERVRADSERQARLNEQARADRERQQRTQAESAHPTAGGGVGPAAQQLTARELACYSSQAACVQLPDGRS